MGLLTYGLSINCFFHANKGSELKDFVSYFQQHVYNIYTALRIWLLKKRLKNNFK
jgi:hypothetical protein